MTTTDGPSDSSGRVASGANDEDDQRERYRELLEELRTIIPGVQVLFGFLLTVPFSSRFDELDSLGRGAFAGSLLAAALATIVFLTPAAYHRVKGGDDRRRRIVFSVRAELGGMGLLAVAVVLAVFVVVRFIFGTTAGAVFAATVSATMAAMWWLLPSTDGD